MKPLDFDGNELRIGDNVIYKEHSDYDFFMFGKITEIISDDWVAFGSLQIKADELQRVNFQITVQKPVPFFTKYKIYMLFMLCGIVIAHSIDTWESTLISIGFVIVAWILSDNLFKKLSLTKEISLVTDDEILCEGIKLNWRKSHKGGADAS